MMIVKVKQLVAWFKKHVLNDRNDGWCWPDLLATSPCLHSVDITYTHYFGGSILMCLKTQTTQSQHTALWHGTKPVEAVQTPNRYSFTPAVWQLSQELREIPHEKQNRSGKKKTCCAATTDFKHLENWWMFILRLSGGLAVSYTSDLVITPGVSLEVFWQSAYRLCHGLSSLQKVTQSLQPGLLSSATLVGSVTTFEPLFRVQLCREAFLQRAFMFCFIAATNLTDSFYFHCLCFPFSSLFVFLFKSSGILYFHYIVYSIVQPQGAHWFNELQYIKYIYVYLYAVPFLIEPKTCGAGCLTAVFANYLIEWNTIVLTGQYGLLLWNRELMGVWICCRCCEKHLGGVGLAWKKTCRSRRGACGRYKKGPDVHLSYKMHGAGLQRQPNRCEF